MDSGYLTTSEILAGPEWRLQTVAYNNCLRYTTVIRYVTVTLGSRILIDGILGFLSVSQTECQHEFSPFTENPA